MNYALTNRTTQGDRTNTLLSMLTYRRPAGSKTERAFIREYIAPLGLHYDAMGNLYKRIGDSPIAWSCHTDTVHREGGRQHISAAGDMVMLTKETESRCLGADDTAGIWLMREMILAERPGLYIFHRQEECGGVGSEYIAKHTPELLDGVQAAIALDRRGTNSIITHQSWGRCCSDTFAHSLGRELGLGYKPDSGGIFTDTANYINLVGECSNLSVGYYNEHSKNESLDMRHLIALREALLDMQDTALVFERQAGDIDQDDIWSYDNREPYDGGWFEDERRNNNRGRSMRELIQDHPTEVADLLEEYGFDWNSLAQEIYVRSGGKMPRGRLG